MSETEFKPAWWLRNSHLQTLWPAVCRSDIKGLPLERERLELPDGDFIDLDWLGRERDAPLVLLLHGFEGNIDSHYAKGMLKTIYDQGWRAVFMHFRGCSGEPNRLPRGYHSGETSDVAFVAGVLRNRYPTTYLAAVGYSLGGNVLLKWLGETGISNPLKTAIAISVPFDLHKASSSIQHGFSRFYQWYLIKCARERLAKKFKYVNPPIDTANLTVAGSIREFDMNYTVPLHGFANVDQYYDMASSRRYLRSIAVPTLILHAKDDPFMSEDVIPDPEELSDKIKLELTEYGGHVGFVGGKYPWRPEYWLEKRVPAYLQEFFS